MSFKAVVLSAVAATAIAGNVHDRSYYQAKFYDWLSVHKVDIQNGEQFTHFLANFANNEDIISVHNANVNATYTLGHNKFSHLSLDEWKSYVNLGLQKPAELSPPLFVLEAKTGLPDSVDHVAAGSVTPVKDQGQCGSCWSFSATGAMEGRNHKATGVLTSLSEQHLVDCDSFKNGGTDLGCNGGLMDSAFTWAQKNGGLAREDEYVYVSGTTKERGTCQEGKYTKYSAPLGYVDVKTGDDNALMTALVDGPVSVAIEADQASFQLYKSGVFTGACGTNLDHGVLAVGYGTDSGLNYYNVKNSWGAGWGENGYIRIQRGANLCGILNGPPSYPKY